MKFTASPDKLQTRRLDGANNHNGRSRDDKFGDSYTRGVVSFGSPTRYRGAPRPNAPRALNRACNRSPTARATTPQLTARSHNLEPETIHLDPRIL